MELVQKCDESYEIIQMAAIDSRSKEIFHETCTPQSNTTFNLPAEDKYFKYLGLQKVVEDDEVGFLLQVNGYQ